MPDDRDDATVGPSPLHLHMKPLTSATPSDHRTDGWAVFGWIMIVFCGAALLFAALGVLAFFSDPGLTPTD